MRINNNKMCKIYFWGLFLKSICTDRYIFSPPRSLLTFHVVHRLYGILLYVAVCLHQTQSKTVHPKYAKFPQVKTVKLI